MTVLETRARKRITLERTEPALVDSTVPGRRHRVWSAVASAALTVLLVALLGLAGAIIVIPRAMGAVPLTVLTGSMQPTLAPGDLVVVRPTPVDEIRMGDVVTFQPVSDDPTLVTHRVVGISLGTDGVSGFTTQGDANNVQDDPITAEQVQGRVAYSIPYVGHLTSAAWGPRVVTVAGVGLLGFGLVTFVLAFRKNDTQTKDVDLESGGSKDEEERT